MNAINKQVKEVHTFLWWFEEAKAFKIFMSHAVTDIQSTILALHFTVAIYLFRPFQLQIYHHRSTVVARRATPHSAAEPSPQCRRWQILKDDQTLESYGCFNWNSLSGPVPSNLNNLTSVRELYLSNNNLNGPLPNLTGMNFLNSLQVVVEQLEREVAELRHALADKQEQENVMLQQEQRVTEDAHRFAEQDAATQRYAAQVLQET
ncbi:putative leucine-rich repeat receptor-like protein kinase [Camellia lanceoleosa]|uniref:Leucine-rich repeat receptor-like protein kinase n=1 Tax=Camellia lanceoleosa TaxID=1840588 RepID=A0ACC0J5Y7_9ERIC|nr:putative leucine-rich repeat receptor-like protein kinase [Camellia lanceoleosa]